MRAAKKETGVRGAKRCNRWWILLLALLAGFLLGLLIPDGWLQLHSGLHL